MSSIALSIDWDFFTPGAARMWEHSSIDETLHFLWENWKQDRLMTMADKVKAVNATGFWKWLSKWVVLSPNRQVVVSESHAAMHDLLTYKHSTLLLFDSHHDCYPLSPWNDDAEPDCGNWGTFWMKKRNKKGQVLWVSQLKQRDENTIKSRIEYSVRKNVRAYVLKGIEPVLDSMCEKAGGKIKMDFIHICRSGCWAPPWTDKDFLTFLEESGFDCRITKHRKFWSPTLDRWKNGKVRRLYDNLQSADY